MANPRSRHSIRSKYGSDFEIDEATIDVISQTLESDKLGPTFCCVRYNDIAFLSNCTM